MKKKKILLVDDEANLLLLVKSILEENYEIHTAENGIEALEKIEVHEPDLVIMDIMMPEMSGTDILKILRNNPATKDMKVMILSVVSAQEWGERNIKKHDVHHYMQKPFEVDKLRNIVDKLVLN